MAKRGRKPVADNKPKAEGKRKGSHMLSMVTRVGTLKRRRGAKLDIVTIGRTTVHSHHDHVHYDADGEKKQGFIGMGNVSKQQWSGSLMGDNVEREYADIVQKVVKVEVIPAPEGKGDGKAEVIETSVKTDSDGTEGKEKENIQTGGDEK